MFMFSKWGGLLFHRVDDSCRRASRKKKKRALCWVEFRPFCANKTIRSQNILLWENLCDFVCYCSSWSNKKRAVKMVTLPLKIEYKLDICGTGWIYTILKSRHIDTNASHIEQRSFESFKAKEKKNKLSWQTKSHHFWQFIEPYLYIYIWNNTWNRFKRRPNLKQNHIKRHTAQLTMSARTK